MTSSAVVPIVAEAMSETSRPLSQAIGLTLSDGWQGLVGDKVQAWRLEKAAEVSAKLQEKFAQRGVSPKLENIPARYAYTWFDQASKEDESEIQDLFAELLANAAEGNADALNRRCVDLVGQLTPPDAKLLKKLSQEFFRAPRWGEPTYKIDHLYLQSSARRGEIELSEASIDNLLSLEILRLVMELQVDQGKFASSIERYFGDRGAGDLTQAIGVRNSIYLTAQGRMLCRALNLDSPNRS